MSSSSETLTSPQKHVFDETVFKSIHLKNRFFRSATWEHINEEDGKFTQEFYDIYERLAKGGVGSIIVSATSVAGNDDELPLCARIHTDDLIPGHRKLVDIIHSHKCAVFDQLAFGNYNKIVDGNVIPKVKTDDLTAEDIAYVKSLFISGAVRAQKAGYDGVQLHCAHGYFLSRFISPLHNHRTDGYGGAPENRCKIIVEILEGIRKEAPGLPVLMKINSTDVVEGGLTQAEAMVICKRMADAGIDAIEVSGGDTLRKGIVAGVNESYYSQFATELGKAVSIPILLVGGNRSLKNIEAILAAGGVSYISLSRPLVCEPDLPNRWASGDTAPSRCASCNTCLRTGGVKCVLAEIARKKAEKAAAETAVKE